MKQKVTVEEAINRRGWVIDAPMLVVCSITIILLFYLLINVSSGRFDWLQIITIMAIAVFSTFVIWSYLSGKYMVWGYKHVEDLETFLDEAGYLDMTARKGSILAKLVFNTKKKKKLMSEIENRYYAEPNNFIFKDDLTVPTSLEFRFDVGKLKSQVLMGVISVIFMLGLASLSSFFLYSIKLLLLLYPIVGLTILVVILSQITLKKYRRAQIENPGILVNKLGITIDGSFRSWERIGEIKIVSDKFGNNFIMFKIASQQFKYLLPEIEIEPRLLRRYLIVIRGRFERK